MSEERFKDIEKTIKELSEKVSHLDKSFVALDVSLEDYVGWTKQLEKTIRHLDDTVRDMSEQHQKIPYDRIRDIQNSIDPVHETLRKHERDFLKKTDAHVLVGLSVFFITGIIILLGVFGDYVLGDMKEDILNSANNNKNLILNNSKAIDDHKIDSAKLLNNVRIYGEHK